ncbi:hypothetical protein J6590_068785 [Homalodisca vitripennis]|nr:hypothetical protein J6590_068785 [Homalodisca vitripennis]
MHDTASNSATKLKAFGRSKKIKSGRPIILKTIREEQVRDAKKGYSQQNPETNRDALRCYTEKHPEVNRAAVRCYEDLHFGAGQDRVQVFRLMKPKVREFRHLPNSLARNIVSQVVRIGKSGVVVKVRTTVTHLPLSVYHFTQIDISSTERATTTTYFLFAPSKFLVGTGTLVDFLSSRWKEECTIKVYSLDAPGQRFATKVEDVQFVNRCRLYIDDGEERRNITMGRSLDIGTIDAIANYLDSIKHFIGDFCLKFTLRA